MILRLSLSSLLQYRFNKLQSEFGDIGGIPRLLDQVIVIFDLFSILLSIQFLSQILQTMHLEYQQNLLVFFLAIPLFFLVLWC